MRKNITVLPYDPIWPLLFEEESQIIESALKENAVHIYHVGSTAIPGLPAKPVIDIIAEVINGDRAVESLINANYSFEGEWNIPFKFGLKKREPYKVNLHVFEVGHPEIELNLCFRDYLRSHSDERDRYADLKYELLKNDESYVKNESPFAGYTLGKYDLIQSILRAAQFDRARVLQCSHPKEWEVAKKIVLKAGSGLDLAGAYQDPNRVDWVLYKGTFVVGYLSAQVQDHQVVLRFLSVLKEHQSAGLGQYFLENFEKWCKKRGVKEIRMDEPEKASAFFKKAGYLSIVTGESKTSLLKVL